MLFKPSLSQEMDLYAKVLIEHASNVQPGVPVILHCPIEAAAFCHAMVHYAYERGASEVIVEWSDDALTRARYLHADEEVLGTYPDWKVDKLRYYYERGAHLIYITAEDPGLLKGIDPSRILRASQASNAKTRDLTENYVLNDRLSWVVAPYPSLAWAKQVFPSLSDEDAYQCLEQALMKTARMKEANPVEAWKEHSENLQRRANRLNEWKLKSLHYQNAKGTDLHVALPDGHLWMGGSEKNEKGVEFLANLPTEEIFTLPNREGVDGTLVSSKPFVYHGNIVEDFTLHFEKGEVVSFSAKKGEEILQKLFEEDPHARRLGEVALVPYDSPISKSNILFYNTLLDENASCHFAFGACYPNTLEGGESMSEEELHAHGANTSQIHADFMIGTSDLSIRGETQDGDIVDIFIDGNFAF